jgi:hypothetical protein
MTKPVAKGQNWYIRIFLFRFFYNIWMLPYKPYKPFLIMNKINQYLLFII